MFPLERSDSNKKNDVRQSFAFQKNGLNHTILELEIALQENNVVNKAKAYASSGPLI
jgi:hypothetical protein